MCQRSLFTPSFLPLYKLFTTDLATWGFLSAAVEIRLLDFVLQIYRVFFPRDFKLLYTQPCELNPGRGERAAPVSGALLPSNPFSCTLLQALHINLKLTEAIAQQVCSQCFQTGLFHPYPFMEYILYNYMYLSNC